MKYHGCNIIEGNDAERVISPCKVQESKIVRTFVLVCPGSVPGVAQLGNTLVHDFSVEQLLVLQVL